MKKFLILFLAMAAVAVFSAVSFAGIETSKHDFSGEGWSGGRICIVCHTPHNAKSPTDGYPLWNHAETSATYTLYDTSTLDAALTQPDGISKLCLSCHDGTVAVDAFGDSMGGDKTIAPGEAGYIGVNLRGTHPVSFTYDTDLADDDGELHDPVTQLSGLGGTIAADMLFNNSLECSSCHDPHNNDNAPFLVMSNASSDLCLTCHDK